MRTVRRVQALKMLTVRISPFGVKTPFKEVPSQVGKANSQFTRKWKLICSLFSPTIPGS